jgi:hypothetical protein
MMMEKQWFRFNPLTLARYHLFILLQSNCIFTDYCQTFNFYLRQLLKPTLTFLILTSPLNPPQYGTSYKQGCDDASGANEDNQHAIVVLVNGYKVDWVERDNVVCCCSDW